MLLRTILITLGLVLLPTTIVANPDDHPSPGDPKWFKNIDRTNIPLCYGYACKIKTAFSLSDQQWQKLKNLFRPLTKTANWEREKIRLGIKWLEQWAGEQSPTHRDKAKNYHPDAVWPGQLDCIDETTNSTTYMTLFAEQGWLRFHRVEPFVQRSDGFFLGHYSAHIYDIRAKRHYAVDSWYLDNGQAPLTQRLEAWKRREPLAMPVEMVGINYMPTLRSRNQIARKLRSKIQPH